MLVMTLFVLTSCQPDKIETTPTFSGMSQPPHFPPPHYNNPKNPITREGFELGRKLFYDPILSRDSSISCASCHTQSQAFADRFRAVSTGIEGRQGKRNSPSMSNLAWYPFFMWDGGIRHIETMPFSPLVNPLEMDNDFVMLMERLQKNKRYQAEFEKVFGPKQFDDQKFFFVLAQFMAMLVSAESPYDRFVLNKGSLTTLETEGLSLFRTHCEQCHKEPLFTDFSYVNNGIDSVYNDVGHGRVTRLPQDTGSFRVPSLRNVGITEPYMHDGRFNTLQEVLQHYATGVLPNGRLDSRLSGPLNLTSHEQDAIIAFLHTLTDQNFITDPRFSNPFK
jgi:cytochrome c peroxidase